MTTVFINDSDQPWGLGGAIFSSRETAMNKAKELAKILYPIKINEETFSDRLQEAIDDITDEMIKDINYADRDDFYQSYRDEIDKKAEAEVLEDITEVIWQSLEQIIVEEADMISSRLKLSQNYWDGLQKKSNEQWNCANRNYTGSKKPISFTKTPRSRTPSSGAARALPRWSRNTIA